MVAPAHHRHSIPAAVPQVKPINIPHQTVPLLENGKKFVPRVEEN